jgi:hypothetical protein
LSGINHTKTEKGKLHLIKSYQNTTTNTNRDIKAIGYLKKYPHSKSTVNEILVGIKTISVQSGQLKIVKLIFASSLLSTLH